MRRVVLRTLPDVVLLGVVPELHHLGLQALQLLACAPLTRSIPVIVCSAQLLRTARNVAAGYCEPAVARTSRAPQIIAAAGVIRSPPRNARCRGRGQQQAGCVKHNGPVDGIDVPRGFMTRRIEVGISGRA